METFHENLRTLRVYLKNKNENDMTHIEKLKKYETIVLIDLILSNISSLQRNLLGHSNKNKTTISLNKLILSNLSFTTGSDNYVDIKKKQIISKKKYKKNEKTSIIETIFELNDNVIVSITDCLKYKKQGDNIFTDKKGKNYEMFYKNSTKRNNSFETYFMKLLYNYLKKAEVTEEFLYDFSKMKFNNLFETPNDETPKVAMIPEISTEIEAEVKKLSNEKWEELLFEKNFLKRDCDCGKYGLAVYEHLMKNKSILGLRIDHSPYCSKIIKS